MQISRLGGKKQRLFYLIKWNGREELIY
jgi:hypothetical protein